MRRIKSIFLLAVVFILAGAILTLENMGIVSGISRLWPLFLLAVGAGFCIVYFDRKKKDLGLLWLGSALCQYCFFFLYLNYTSWRLTATLWPVFLAISGMSFFVMYLAGRTRLFFVLAVGLVMLAGVFYLVFSVSLGLWPLSLVAFGTSLLIVNHYYLKK